MQVYSKRELLAREEIKYKHYLDVRCIEFKTLASMIYQETIPSAIKEINYITQSKEYMPPSVIKKAHNLADFIENINALVSKLEHTLEKALAQKELKDKCLALLYEVTPISEQLRSRVDFMENYISKQHLAYPNYEDLFFGVDF